MSYYNIQKDSTLHLILMLIGDVDSDNEENDFENHGAICELCIKGFKRSFQEGVISQQKRNEIKRAAHN